MESDRQDSRLMAREEDLYHILDFILNQATHEELEVIDKALKRRTGAPTPGLSGLDPRGLAQNLARKIQEQLSATLDIGKVARDIVADLVHQKDPDMPAEKIEALMDEWLPRTRAETAESEAVPPDVLITMITQYVSFKRGTLSSEEQKGLPENWLRKYWDAFPEASKDLITDLLNGNCDEVHFWKEIIDTID